MWASVAWDDTAIYLLGIISSHFPNIPLLPSPWSLFFLEFLKCTPYSRPLHLMLPLAEYFLSTQLQGLLRNCHLINKAFSDNCTKNTAPHPIPVSLSCFISSIDSSSSVILCVCLFVACLLRPTMILDPKRTRACDYELFLSKGKHFPPSVLIHHRDAPNGVYEKSA